MKTLNVKGQRISEMVYVLRWDSHLFGLERSMNFKRSKEEYKDSFLRAVFAFPDILEVTLSSTELKIKSSLGQDQSALATSIAALLRDHQPTQLHLPKTDASAGEITDKDNGLLDENVQNKMEELFDNQVRPALAAHGGNVNIVNFYSGELQLSFTGGCQGCSQISATLRDGIERLIKQKFPEVTSITDVTNHQDGEKPYFK